MNLTVIENKQWGMLMKLLFNQKYSDMIIIVKRNMERNIGNEVNSNVKFRAYVQNLKKSKVDFTQKTFKIPVQSCHVQ